MDTKEANICFHHSERLKSNFLLVAQTLDSLSGLQGRELEGAEKVMRALFEALKTEIRIAGGQIPSWELEPAELKVTEAEGSVEFGDYDKARENLSEGLSRVTTLSQQYIELLLAANLL